MPPFAVLGVMSAANTPEISTLDIRFSTLRVKRHFGIRAKGTRTKRIDLRFHV